MEELQVLERHENWSTSDCCLKCFKGSMFLLIPGLEHVRLCKVKQGSGQCGEVTDELTVEVDKPQKGLYVSLIFWNRPLLDSRDLDRIHRHVRT